MSKQIQLRRDFYDASLPPAACPQAMLDSVREVAISERTSASAVIRYAVSLFLDQVSAENIQNSLEANNDHS